jgi:uncharacterized membrane protein YfcA
MTDLLFLLSMGGVAGLMAGLLGIGGGIIIVSTLALTFAGRGLPQAYVMHLAIGTSLAAIAAGAFASFRAHHRRGAVAWDVVKAMTPGLLVGVAGGALVARWMPTGALKGFFLVLLAYVIATMTFDFRPKSARALPGRRGLLGAGAFIGVVSSFFGGGAAAIGVPFFTACSMDTHRAIGTCSALGFPLAVAGSIAYAAAGWGVPGMPPWSVGFVYVPAFVGISSTSMLAAPWGARLAHRLQGATLRRIFALVLLALGVKLAIAV